MAKPFPEPRSLSQVLRLPTHTKEKWGEDIRAEITGLFDSGTFSLNEKPLPAGSCGKSVIFPHLVGLHFLDKIYIKQYNWITLPYIYFILTSPPQKNVYYFNAIYMFILPLKSTKDLVLKIESIS